jgi:alpha-N-arabinofuranosidase
LPFVQGSAGGCHGLGRRSRGLVCRGGRDEVTTIWADFKGKDPNRAFVEINVRPSVFYPEKEGINFITVRGFTLEQAAAPWVSPTAEQIGLIGTHWSRGWIIERNTIRYSTCVGVTLGKHGDEHDHTYDYANITIPQANARGWDKVGYHIVRDNHIYHCGEGGIQGSLGCAFSTITGNEVHDIRKEFAYGGCETGGIKLHGAVDVLIANNHVYKCEHWGGIWLDWMAQGARVTGNLLHDNSQDLMFEVNHGPYLVDHNILLSAGGVTEASGGGAFVHNLWAGTISIWTPMAERITPFFKPHSTEIIGSANVAQDDDRFYNNLFVGGGGTAGYDVHGLAITAEGNVFVGGSAASTRDHNSIIAKFFEPAIKLSREVDDWWLEMKMDPAWTTAVSRSLVVSSLLGRASRPDAPFEQRDGTPYRLDLDYFGAPRDGHNPAPCPFSGCTANIRLKIWPKA